MPYVFEQLLKLRSGVEAQVEDLESGRVKVLRLYNGGSTDEDCSREHLATLHCHLYAIDAMLSESCIRSPSPFESRTSDAMLPMAVSSRWLPSD
jgi:hypothetical protein